MKRFWLCSAAGFGSGCAIGSGAGDVITGNPAGLVAFAGGILGLVAAVALAFEWGADS